MRAPRATHASPATRASIALLSSLGLAAFVAASNLEAAVQVARVNAATALVLVMLSALSTAWAIRVARHPTRSVLCAGALGCAALAALWAATRTIGVPVSAPPGVMDTITAADELLLAVFCLIAAFAPDRGSRSCSTLGLVAIGASFVALSMGCSVPRPDTASPGASGGGVVWFCHV